MPDNLTIQISADSGKARADIELLKAQLRAAQKEARDFAKAGAEAGDKFPSTQLTAATNRVGELDAQLKSLNRTTRDTSNVMDVLATKSMRRLLTQFDNVGKSAQNIAMVMGGVTGSFAGGFLAASVFKSISTLINQLDAVAESLRKIRDEAQKIGLKPVNVQAVQEIAAGKGLKPDAAAGFMSGVAEAAAKEQTGAGKELTGGVKVMRGEMGAVGDTAKDMGSQIKAGVTILRGGSPLTLDLADAYKTLGVSMKNVTGDADSLLKKQKEVATAFLAQQKSLNPLQLNELAKALKFDSSADALKLLPAIIADIDKKIAELNASSRGATDDAIKLQEAADGAKARVQAIFSEGAAGFSTFRNEVNLAFNTWLEGFLTKSLPDFIAGVKTLFSDLWTALGAQEGLPTVVAGWWAALPDFQPWIDKTIAAFQGMWDSIKSAAASAWSTLSSSFPGDPSVPAMPMAGGGMIRGPGSGTSDSILARLSNGEFVMRAAAVDRWGPQFMAALNNLRNPFSFAQGGLVPRFAAGGLVPRFAAGGLVAAGASGKAGPNVTLVFGSQSFPMSADDDVVDRLVSSANRARMRSAGIKPSWYGG